MTFGRNQASSNSASSVPENGLELNIIQTTKKEDEDGMQHMLELDTLKCRFSDDLRMREVRACLQTTRPILINLNQAPDVSDHEFIEEEEKFLLLIVQRTMALPVARGIFTLHTINPIPTEPVIIPELNLKGKSLSKKTTIDLSRLEAPSNMTYWPSFHNGVASGLTISPQARDLSNAWIKSHLAKNFELTNEQAGFLYGMGLTGHLANFSMLNIHDALTRRHDLTNIAILLGLAASKMGSMDLNVTRLISMHIRAMMPPVEIELEIPYNIQISALLSLGLVYVKSANKHISYVLLKEIGRLPGNEIEKDLNSLDREAYSLTAGLSLGLILLEKGKKSLTIMDSTFTDELYHYMVGGHKDYGGCLSGNGPPAAQNPITNEQQYTMNNQTYKSSFTQPNNNNSYIREGESINTNVTCPGATIALGLIYFNSCDRLISDWFAPPDSAYLLDSIRPDFLLLRTLARNLIMWKFILPSQKWIINQLSPILKSVLRNDRILGVKFADLLVEPEPQESDTVIINEPSKKTKNEPMVKVSFVTRKVRISNDDDQEEESESESSSLSTSSASTSSPSSSSFSDDDDEDDDDDDDLEEENSELNADTDDDDNMVVTVESKKKTKKKSKKNKNEKKTHLLSDLIEFGDVDDFNLYNQQLELEDKQQVIINKKINKSKKTNQDDEEFEDLAADIDDVTEENNSSQDEEQDNDDESSSEDNLIDDETKLEAFRHIIAGACMSIGLKFAGTFNNEAYQTLVS